MNTLCLLCAMMMSADQSAEAPLQRAECEPEPPFVLSEKANKRVRLMKADIESFSLNLEYNGPQNKPFYHLSLRVSPIGRDAGGKDIFHRETRISKTQAGKIIDHLATNGFFDHAVNTGELEKLPRQCYVLSVRAGNQDLSDVLGWNMPLIRNLDALRTIFDGQAGKDFDRLLARIAGLRQSLLATHGNNGSQVIFLNDGAKTIIDVRSKRGIDTAVVSRQVAQWPDAIAVRLHLSGLESFKVIANKVSMEWSVSSTGDNSARTYLDRGDGAMTVAKDDPYYTAVQIVGRERKIPLKDGYFTVVLPKKLFAGNPTHITLKWIDFYRN